MPEEFEFLTCGNCGIQFAAPRTFIAARRAGDQGVSTFYCPNGHRLSFRDSEVDKLRRERDNLKQQIARVEDERSAAWRAEVAATEARRKAERELKKTLNRAGAGVCPCCHRNFVALARHMKTKHPDVVPLQAKR